MKCIKCGRPVSVLMHGGMSYGYNGATCGSCLTAGKDRIASRRLKIKEVFHDDGQLSDFMDWIKSGRKDA